MMMIEFVQVIKAYDHKYQQYVALKLVRNEKRFHRQAEEEIRILEHLRRQDNDGQYNVIHMLDNFNFRNHKCITFELMSINLYELIKKNKFQGFNLTVSGCIGGAVVDLLISHSAKTPE